MEDFSEEITDNRLQDVEDLYMKYLNMSTYYRREAIYREKNIYFKYEVLLSYYAAFLIVIGTICNLLSLIVMNSKYMKKYACMRYLSALSISDLIILYQWNLNSVYNYNWSRPPFFFDLEEKSILMCRIIAFMAFCSLQVSAWLLSIVSFDRLMIVYSLFWKLHMHKAFKIRCIIGAVVVTVIGLNSHLLFNNGYVNDLYDQRREILNFTQTYNLTTDKFIIPKQDVVCYKSRSDDKYIFPKWETVHLFFYCLIPFTIMLTCNSIIIYNVKFASKVESVAQNSVKRKRRMTLMLIVVTFAFIILTLPSVIVHTFFRDSLKKKPYRRLVNMIVNNLLYTSHSINFFLYILSAPNFRAELYKLFSRFNFFARRKNSAHLIVKSHSKGMNDRRENSVNSYDKQVGSGKNRVNDAGSKKSAAHKKVNHLELQPLKMQDASSTVSY